MNDVYGIAFSTSGLHLSHLSIEKEPRRVISTDLIPYGFEFSFDRLLGEENLSLLSAELNSYQAQNKITQFILNISLPVNFSHIKRIAISPGADPKLIQAQVNWELNHYLPGAIEEYKILKSEQEYEFNSYREIGVICILHSLLNRLKDFAIQSNAVLNKILIDNYSVENYLKYFDLFSTLKNQIVIRIDSFFINTQLFIAGNYYTHYFDLLSGSNSTLSRNERVLELVKDRINLIGSTLEQLPFVMNKEIEIFVYGDGHSSAVKSLLAKNLTPHISALADPERDSRGSSVESIGVAII